MTDLDLLVTLLEYTDWSNDRLLEAASPMTDEQLDLAMEIGPGTLRKVLLHIHNGELVWLRRWQGRGGGEHGETPWPSESEAVTVAQLRERLAAVRRERAAFLASVREQRADLGRVQRYRDSKGSLYRASLRDMLIQGIMHSKHHQAQAVNIIRRLGGAWPELDYMYRVRTEG